jgi:hypothetical protein
MAFTFTTTLRNGRANAIQTELGSGGKLQIWSGSAGVYTTKLAEWTWTTTAFATAASGAVAMNAPTTNPVTPLTNGTAGIARLCKTDGITTVIIDLSVGTSATDVILSNLNVVTTSPITLVSFGITEAA